MFNKKYIYYQIAAIHNLDVKEDLDTGIPIGCNINLSNDKGIVDTLLSGTLTARIGELEAARLRDCKTFFYRIYGTDHLDKVEAFKLSLNTEIMDFLYCCDFFITQTWLIDDNAIHIENAISEIIELDVKNNRSLSHAASTNLLGNINIFSTAEVKEVILKKKDLLKLSALNKTIRNKKYSEIKDQPLTIINQEGNGRLGIAFGLLLTIRSQHDLGLKISYYCSFFELFLSTDGAEVLHKLSERIAYLLRSTPQERYDLFKRMKEIYTVRSNVTHGSMIRGKDVHKLINIAQFADNVARELFNKYFQDDHYKWLITEGTNDELREYYNMLVLGQTEFNKRK